MQNKAFFQNREMNELYIFMLITGLANSMITLFVPIYLYTLGYAIKEIILYFLLIAIFFFLLGYIGAKIVSKIGIKHSILISTPLIIAYYLGLRFIPEMSALFVLLPLLLAIRNILFNYGYHASFLESSKAKKRGAEVSMMHAIGLATFVVGPILGGFIAATYGFPTLFVIGAALSIVGVLPLFYSSEKYEKIEFSGEFLYRDIFSKKNRPMLTSFSGYAIEQSINREIWPIFLIILLVKIEQVGSVFGISIGISILIFYFIGHLTDKYDKRKLLQIGTLFYFFSWIGKMFANSFTKVLVVDTYQNFARNFLWVPWEAYSYDLAAKTDKFKFIVQRELIFNLSRIIVMPFVILLFHLNFYPFILSFIIAAVFSLLYGALKETTKSV